jgi:SAM-dependent methyltransferase
MPGEWGGTAEAYEATFGKLCAGSVEDLLDAVAGVLGRHRGSLLDVGTGPGTLARAAVLRGFEVTACDPEPSMIDLARATCEQVSYDEAGLPGLPYEDRAFDAVCANFVVNHTHRPREAARELARVSRGVVAVTVWPRQRTVLNGLWSGVVRDAMASTPDGVLLAAEDDFERSEDGLAALLEGAGLQGVRTFTLEWDFAIAADELWTAVEAGVATIGTTYLAQDVAGRARMLEAYAARTAELVSPDGLLHFPTFALLSIGTSAGFRSAVSERGA